MILLGMFQTNHQRDFIADRRMILKWLLEK